MSDNTATSGTVTYEVPIRFTVNLDTDEQFRDFTAEDRSEGIRLFAELAVNVLQKVVISANGPSVSVGETVTLLDTAAVGA